MFSSPIYFYDDIVITTIEFNVGQPHSGCKQYLDKFVIVKKTR